MTRTKIGIGILSLTVLAGIISSATGSKRTFTGRSRSAEEIAKHEEMGWKGLGGATAVLALKHGDVKFVGHEA